MKKNENAEGTMTRGRSSNTRMSENGNQFRILPDYD